MPRRTDLPGLDLNELRLFGAVASRLSFAAAAAAMGVPKSTVSRKVALLEERLGVRLLQRTTRRVALTDVGAALLERWQRIGEELAEIGSMVGRYGASPRGTLRVTAPYTLGRDYLAPLIPEFLARCPEVRVVLQHRNQPLDLVTRGVDVAVWPWPVRGPNYATRLVSRLQPTLYASPAYLDRRGHPATPGDLADHDLLFYVGGDQPVRMEWTLRHGSHGVTIPVEPRLACNDLGPLRVAAAGGAGIVLIDELLIRDELQRGVLVPVLPGWANEPIDVRAVFPSRSGLAPKVRAFVDLVAERLAPLKPR
jgi:LysR family transcriptional regulator, regulator for bpeEF and oprC